MTARSRAGRPLWLCFLFLLVPALAGAQDAAPKDADLRERLKQLEKKVKELEGAKKDAPKKDKEFKAEDKDGEKKKSSYDAEKGYAKGKPDKSEDQGFKFKLPWSMSLKVGGKLRFRGEFRDAPDYRIPGTFGVPAGADRNQNQDFVLMRTRVFLDFQVHKHLRAYVRFQDSRSWGDTPLATDRAEFHLNEGYLELQKPFDLPLWVKAGRFAVPDLGDVRTMSSLIWHNVGRSWDGTQIIYKVGADKDGKNETLWLTAFIANIGEAQTFFPVAGDENDDLLFSGIYASYRGVKKHEFDIFLYWRHLSNRAFTSEDNAGRQGLGPGQFGDRKDFTMGFRFKGAAGPIGYSGEVNYQWGDVAGDPLRAYAGALRTWAFFKLNEDGMGPGFVLEASYASGDRNPTDGKRQTFDPLLPFGHFYNGHQDLFGWSNLIQGLFGFKWQMWKGLSFHSHWHLFWLDKRKDAWYRVNKAKMRQDATGASNSFVGTEVDLFVKAKVWDRISIWAGYSHFWAGDYVRDTGRGNPGRGSGDQDWVFFMAEAKF